MNRNSLSSRKGLLLVAYVLAVIILFQNTVAQAQNLVWAKKAGGVDGENGLGIAVDKSGNSYVSGNFSGTPVFGAGGPNQTTLTSAGKDDIFIAKYNPAGALVWAKRAGGNGVDLATATGVDTAGNVYITGYFDTSATFGAGEANQTTLTVAVPYDVFVAKYNSAGTLQWAKQAGGTSEELAQAIAVDAAGNSYITGYFFGTSTFGLGEPNQTTLTAAASTDIFVAKYHSNGALAWAKRAGGTSGEIGKGIAVDISGNAYVTGSFASSATFGLGEANQTTLTAAGSRDIFLAKYDGSGALLWAKRAGGADDVNDGEGVSVDGSGNAHVTGYFTNTATFGLGEANQTTLTSAGWSDMFLAKYDRNGALLWARRAGGADDYDSGNAVAADSAGSSYVAGNFRGMATFGQGEPNQTTLNAGSLLQQVFVAKYNENGTLAWVTQAGSANDDEGANRITVDGTGNSYVTGFFYGAATFGAGEINQTILTSAPLDAMDMFVAKFEGSIVPVNCTKNSLQLALNQALPGQTILVSGTCNENILIRNEKQRITIDGSGGGVGTRATVNGSSGVPVFNVRGKGILIQNFNISGGGHGVHVNRGSNAVLNNNVISGSSGSGVAVEQLAFSVLTNNTIQNHPVSGVSVSENSTARVGFNADSDTAASTNTITSNVIGILISQGSSARIVGNTISNNTAQGVSVISDASAELSSNTINNNADGIEVGENSLVQLGEDSGTSIFESPNTTTSANTGFGIRCLAGGTVDGRLGTLAGSLGPTSFDADCIDSLTP